MKLKIQQTIVALAFACGLTTQAQNDLKSHPAFLPVDSVLDLKRVIPEVNVNLPKFLLLEAATGLDESPKNPFTEKGINLKELIKDIQLIRVLVLNVEEKDKSYVSEGVGSLKKMLDQTWMSIVSVPDGGVNVYALTNASGDSMEGISVLVDDGGDVVIVNVVGKVPLAKIISLATSMDKFPKELLKNFSKGMALESVHEVNESGQSANP